MTDTTTINLPDQGWSENRWGNLTYTVHGPSWGTRPPTREGWRCHFIARHGESYTTWTYRKQASS